MDDYVFGKSIFFISFQRFECYTTFIVKELLYVNKIKFFTSISKSKKCRKLHNFDRNQHIKLHIKQYYGIIKTFKVLVIVEKEIV